MNIEIRRTDKGFQIIIGWVVLFLSAQHVDELKRKLNLEMPGQE